MATVSYDMHKGFICLTAKANQTSGGIELKIDGN